MLLFNSLNVLISIVIITSIVTSLYSQPSTIVADNLLFFLFLSLFFFRFQSRLFSRSLMLSFISINHFYSCMHSSTSFTGTSVPNNAFPQSLFLFLFLSLTFFLSLFLSIIRSLPLGKIIPILRYTLEKYAMPKIGWRPEGNHSVDITDNRCVCYVSRVFVYSLHVCTMYSFSLCNCVARSLLSLHDSDFSQHQRS